MIKQYFMVQIGGNIIDTKFDTADDAMKHAKKLFVQDNSIEEADIYRHDEELVLTIKNKDFSK